MASLNLVPNPLVLSIQGGIFIATIVVVKNFYLKPFLALKQKRMQATVEKKSAAEKLLLANKGKIEKLENQIKDAQTQVRGQGQKILDTAQTQKAELIQSAQTQANQALKSIRQQIQEYTQKEKKDLTQMINPLVDQIYRDVLN